MKKLLLSAGLLSALLSSAQGVAINNNGQAADNSAILDVQSTSRGVLLPRMTTLQRTSMMPLTTGLTVYDTETQSYWMYRGDIYGGWAELQHSFQKAWEVSGANAYTSLSGNVGIGTNSPASKLTINGSSPAIGFMNAGTTHSYIRVSGQHLKVSTAVDNLTGKIVFSPKETDRVWIDENGQVGIGTATPSSLLTINGTSPLQQFRHLGSDKGFIQAATNDLVVGTNAGNNTGNLVFQTKAISRMQIDETGRVGIGTLTPSSVLTVNGTEPIIQLRNGDVDKGFVQLVANDIKIGTNLSNTYGRFVIRTNGADRAVVNYKGQMGLNMSPTDSDPTLSVAEDDNGNSGVGLYAGGTRRALFNWNGFNSFLTSSSGTMLLIYRVSTDPFVAHSDGNFSMGTSTKASGYKLSVDGKVIANDFTSMPIGGWPDYVFRSDYPLRSLEEVKAFIRDRGHLPGIPPAAEVEKNGIQLGEMNRKLMEKVEELTLYLIRLQEDMDQLRKQVHAKD